MLGMRAEAGACPGPVGAAMGVQVTCGSGVPVLVPPLPHSTALLASAGHARCSLRRSLCLCFSKMCFLLQSCHNHFTLEQGKRGIIKIPACWKVGRAVRSFHRALSTWAGLLHQGRASPGPAASAKAERSGMNQSCQSEAGIALAGLSEAPFRSFRIKPSLIKPLSAL